MHAHFLPPTFFIFTRQPQTRRSVSPLVSRLQSWFIISTSTWYVYTWGSNLFCNSIIFKYVAFHCFIKNEYNFNNKYIIHWTCLNVRLRFHVNVPCNAKFYIHLYSCMLDFKILFTTFMMFISYPSLATNEFKTHFQF